MTVIEKVIERIEQNGAKAATARAEKAEARADRAEKERAKAEKERAKAEMERAKAEKEKESIVVKFTKALLASGHDLSAAATITGKTPEWLETHI